MTNKQYRVYIWIVTLLIEHPGITERRKVATSTKFHTLLPGSETALGH